MNKVSVIMPVYNTEEYLPRAVESVKNQTYSNWELFLIDDGSTDGSLALCKSYSDKDNRIITLHKKNGGQGSARNMAIPKCSGDYVMFLDSDDWIDEDTMQFLLGAIKKYDADVIECGCRSVSSFGDVEEYIKKETLIMTATECIEHLLGNDDAVGPGACSKLFKLDSIKMKQFPCLAAYEDYQYIYDVCVDIKKYVHIYEPKWNYFHRENSTMTAAFSLRRIALIDAQKGICDILRETGVYEHYLRAQKALCSKQFYILHCLLTHPEIDGEGIHSKELFDSLMTSYCSYMHNPHMGRNKLVLWLMKYLPKFVWKNILAARFS